MMADTEDTSQEALSKDEIERAEALGLAHAKCHRCGRPTLWDVRVKLPQPVRCGRVPCEEGYGAEER